MDRECATAPPLAAAALAALAVLGGCASVRSHLPFWKEPAAAPQPVRELALQVADDAPMPVVLQFWERNTLVVDLQGVPSTGKLTLVPEAGHVWPAQLAFRMAPARFQQLDVRGDERVLLPVSAGPEPTTAQLPPGIYGATTTRLELSWGPAAP